MLRRAVAKDEIFALHFHRSDVLAKQLAQMFFGAPQRGRLDEAGMDAESRYVLLANPAQTRLEPLLQQLLLVKTTPVHKVWEKARLSGLLLADAL